MHYAPGLTHLSVGGLEVSTEEYRGREWAVIELRLQYGCDLGSLAKPPASRRGHMRVLGCDLLIRDSAISSQVSSGA